MVASNAKASSAVPLPLQNPAAAALYLLVSALTADSDTVWGTEARLALAFRMGGTSRVSYFYLLEKMEEFAIEGGVAARVNGSHTRQVSFCDTLVRSGSRLVAWLGGTSLFIFEGVW